MTELGGGVLTARTTLACIHIHTRIHVCKLPHWVAPWPLWKLRQAAELWALTDTQHYEGRMLPAGQQQEVDHVVGNEAEAQDHTAPLLEALACRETGER